jgi:fermentation-respiration switch protein FrsA (DUF1100 family)
MVRRWTTMVAVGILLNACGAERPFYQPNKILYADPARAGVPHELVYFSSGDGEKLMGLYFPARGESRGVVIHCHGNFANVSNHFPASYFFTEHGFDLLVFDYQGYGVSEGRPSRRGTIADGRAAVAFARTRAAGKPLFLFGQSLGAAVAAVVAAEDPDVKAVILEAPFTTYRAIFKDVMKRNFLTWPFSFFVPALAIRRRDDPLEAVARISPRPVLILHGTADRIIPWSMGKTLYDAAREPKKWWGVEGAGHMECRRKAGKTYDETLAGFFQAALTNTSKPPR